MGLEETVNEKVSFLKKQIKLHNMPIVNDTFKVQIEILRSADRERIRKMSVEK